MASGRILGSVGLLVFALAAPAQAGGLSFRSLVRDGAAVDGLNGPIALTVSPDGAHVYVASIGDHSVATFARNPATGDLTYAGIVIDGVGGVTGLGMPSALAISPDGAHVYVTGESDNALVVLARDGATGALTFVEAKRDGAGGVDGIDRASAVAVSPDGAHVYATGEHDDAVAVFARDVTTGALTFVEAERDGAGGVMGIRRPSAVTVSPDGADVYVTGGAGDGVAVFARDASTGALTFVEAQIHLIGGVDGIDRPTAVAVSPDGTSVYVTGHDDGAVAAFARDVATGALTFVEFERDRGDVTGLGGAFAVAVSPDGAYVYVAGENENAISVFKRDAATSALSFVEAKIDGRLGVDGINRASAIAVSPDGAHVYVAGHEDDAVAVFAADRCGNGLIGSDEQCDDGNAIAGDGCSAVCRLELCAPVPDADCRGTAQPSSSVLRFAHGTVDSRDVLRWTSTHADATPLADFGDPTADASYALCVYDASASAQPLLALAAPHDGSCSGVPCWTASSGGFRYRDRLRTPDGLTELRLREGLADGDTRIVVEGRGSDLALPVLPLTPPVIVQLRNTATQACWEATFNTSTVNGPAAFKAVGE